MSQMPPPPLNTPLTLSVVPWTWQVQASPNFFWNNIHYLNCLTHIGPGYRIRNHNSTMFGSGSGSNTRSSQLYISWKQNNVYRTILYYRVATSKGLWAVTFSPDEISGRRWAWFLVRIYDGLMNGDDELCCYYEGDIYNNSTALMHYITSRSYYYIIHN